MSYCAKQKLASVTSADNVKNQVLDKLGSARRKNKNRTPAIWMACRAAQQQKRPAAGPEYARQQLAGETGENQSLRSGLKTGR
jgi:hypothetical protein